jgi:hypothetical protein
MKHELCRLAAIWSIFCVPLCGIYGILKSLHFMWGCLATWEVAMIPLSALSLSMPKVFRRLSIQAC